MTKHESVERAPEKRIHPPISVYVLISLALAAVFWLSWMYLSEHRSAPNNLPTLAQTKILLHDRETQDNVDLLTLLGQLSSNDSGIREAAKKRIIHLARQSDENRKLVVAELLRTVEMPALRYHLDIPATSYLWVNASEIFADLKVVEAIDPLIRCIDCMAFTEYASNTYHHKPAVRALMGMGQLAVPELSAALYDPNPDVRSDVALCLGNIGADKAREALSQASTGEQDIKVRKSIKDSMAAIDRTPFER